MNNGVTLRIPRIELVHFHNGAPIHSTIDDMQGLYLDLAHAFTAMVLDIGSSDDLVEAAQLHRIISSMVDNITPEAVDKWYSEVLRLVTQRYSIAEGEVPF